MIKDTVSKLEDAIRKLDSADSKKKAELVSLLSRLKGEIAGLDETHGEHARSIAGFAEVAAHEATRKTKSGRLLALSMDGLASSAKALEASHPKVVETADEICRFLAGLGI